VNKYATYRIIGAWFMMAVFAAPFAVRSVHAYHVAHHVAGECHGEHDCTNCPVCHFTLAAFTETESPEVEKLPAPAWKPLAGDHDEPARGGVHLSCRLRAPPAA
jgi:hypothetical protein